MLPGRTPTPVDILQMARRHFLLLVAPPLLTLFVALLYSSGVVDVYQSDMLVAIDPQEVPEAFVRSTVTLGAERRMKAIAVQVTSRTNLERMITAHDLYRAERARMPMEDVILKMRNSISVDMEHSGDGPAAFHVRFTHPDPEMARTIAQELGMLFVDLNARDRGSLADATSEFLETQLSDSRTRLQAQEKKLEQFRQLHGQELPSQMQVNLQALQSRQFQVQAALDAQTRDRERLQTIERLQDEAAKQAAMLRAMPSGAPTADTAKQQLLTARSQLAEMQRRYKSDHPDLARLKRVIAELEARVPPEEPTAPDQAPLRPTAGTPATALDSDRLQQLQLEKETLSRQIAAREVEQQRLRSEIGTYQSRLEAVPGLESEWTALTRDYDTQLEAYKELLSKRERARVAAALEEQQIGERFRIVDPASVPVHPVAAARARINAGGFAVGLLFGLGVVVLLEFRDASFRTEEEVLELLALPVLATVPRVETAPERTRRRRRYGAAVALASLSLLAMGYVFWARHLWTSLR